MCESAKEAVLTGLRFSNCAGMLGNRRFCRLAFGLGLVSVQGKLVARVGNIMFAKGSLVLYSSL